jgi:predicted peroxiredoxin
MAKTVLVVNGPTPGSVNPALILGSSAAALGDDVVLFFTPGGASHMVKGELEKIRDSAGPGMPDVVELYDGIRALGGKMIMCELCLSGGKIKREDLREGVEIAGATSFLSDARDATITFAF